MHPGINKNFCTLSFYVSGLVPLRGSPVSGPGFGFPSRCSITQSPVQSRSGLLPLRPQQESKWYQGSSSEPDVCALLTA